MKEDIKTDILKVAFSTKVNLLTPEICGLLIENKKHDYGNSSLIESFHKAQRDIKKSDIFKNLINRLVSIISDLPEWQQNFYRSYPKEIIFAENKKAKDMYSDVHGEMIGGGVLKSGNIYAGLSNKNRILFHEVAHIFYRDLKLSGNNAWIDALDKTQNRAFFGLSHLGLFLGSYKSEGKNIQIEEAFAEITAHYNIAFIKNKGDEDKIEKRMAKKYKYLWPVFKNELLPKLKEYYSEETYKEREKQATAGNSAINPPEIPYTAKENNFPSTTQTLNIIKTATPSFRERIEIKRFGDNDYEDFHKKHKDCGLE